MTDAADTSEIVLPTSEEKIEVIRCYARAYPHIRTFIETGTATGNTPAALVDLFDQIFTIELDPHFYISAVVRFINEPKVTPIYGDSAEVLRLLLPHLHLPAIYWLDGHYVGSGIRGPVDTPIVDEIREVIFTHQPSVVLIDDARLFGTDPAYPTPHEVRRLFRESPVPNILTVENDIIRVIPKS